VSGGSDGRVKVWDLERGVLIRELGHPAEAVWRVVFEEEKAVVLASRNGRTVMEVWSFAPPPEDELAAFASASRTRAALPSSSSLSQISAPAPAHEHFGYTEQASWYASLPNQDEVDSTDHQDEIMMDVYDVPSRTRQGSEAQQHFGQDDG